MPKDLRSLGPLRPRVVRIARPRVVRIAAVALAVLLAACSEPGHSSVEFCDKLAEVTGPEGTEFLLVPGDPARIDGVTKELAALHARAPETISATTRMLLTFFEDFQRVPRNERRDLLAERGDALAEAADSLTEFALDECGLFLRRAIPTPVPTAIGTDIQAPTE